MTDSSPTVTVLCDFDGTITPSDLADFIFSKFAACGLFYSRQWAQNMIDTREEILRTFATISAGPDEIAAALATIEIDPTFPELVAFARQKGIELAIVSDGLDWAIDEVLKAHGIQGLPIYSNHVIIEGKKWSCEFPWFDPSTPLVGVCKPLLVRRYRQNGGRVIFIGDGRSDREAVMEADLVFARDALAQYCREQGIAALGFNNFREVCLQLEPWLENPG
jgi:2-hydroxy-3-keto-5-methylthiopentenyl-1-phosphate phosphatase